LKQLQLLTLFSAPELFLLDVFTMPSATTNGTTNGQTPATAGLSANDNIRRFAAPSRPLSPRAEHTLFHDKTRCFVYGLQPRAVQGMLDFDFICKRKTPSVAGIIYTFGGQFVSKMYWGTSETLLPVYQDVNKAMAKHSDVDTVVNFASSRSVYSSTMELMEYPQIKSIAIIAEGVPERVSLRSPKSNQKKGQSLTVDTACTRDPPRSQEEGHHHHRSCDCRWH
jgi:hypothetical protein